MSEPYIMTISGHRFPFLDPKPEDYRIDDIAHALAHSCRFTGHVRQFYSVAEHCVHVSYAVPAEFALHGLLHDLSEAYLADISRPVKWFLGEYHDIEAHIQDCGQRAFGLEDGMPKPVKLADNRILIDERDELLPRDADYSDWPQVEPLGVELMCWRPEEAKSRFLLRYHALTRRM